MSIPAKMQAVVTADVHTSKVDLVDTPTPQPNEVLIKVKAVTLNPTDWKHVSLIAPPGLVVGCDYAGEIVELGSAVDNGLKVGDKVSGFVHGSKRQGSFAEYTVAKAQNVIKYPSKIKDEEAASAGVAALTAIQALHHRLSIPAPKSDIASIPSIRKDAPKLLIWSGSTAVGQYAIQFGTIAGYYVITTASPKNHDLVTSLGAKEVYDYKDADVAEKISKAHPDLALGLDCISENGTQQLVSKSLGTSGGKFVVLLKPDEEAIALRKDVQIIHTLAYSLLGDEFTYGKAVFSKEQVSADQAFFKPWLNGDGLVSHLFAKGLLKANRIKHMDGGINSIHEGLDYLKTGKASGEKLAYVIST